MGDGDWSNEVYSISYLCYHSSLCTSRFIVQPTISQIRIHHHPAPNYISPASVIPLDSFRVKSAPPLAHSAHTSTPRRTRKIAILNPSSFLLARDSNPHRAPRPPVTNRNLVLSLHYLSLPCRLLVDRVPSPSSLAPRPNSTSVPSRMSSPLASSPPSAPLPIPSPSLGLRRRSPIPVPPAPPVSLDLRAA